MHSEAQAEESEEFLSCLQYLELLPVLTTATQKSSYFLKRSESDPLRRHLEVPNTLQPEEEQNTPTEPGKPTSVGLRLSFHKQQWTDLKLTLLKEVISPPTHQLCPHAPPTTSWTQPKTTELSAGVTSWGYSWMGSRTAWPHVERAGPTIIHHIEGKAPKVGL